MLRGHFAFYLLLHGMTRTQLRSFRNLMRGNLSCQVAEVKKLCKVQILGQEDLVLKDTVYASVEGGGEPLEVATQCAQWRGAFQKSNPARREGLTQKPPCHTEMDVKWLPGCIMAKEQKSCL